MAADDHSIVRVGLTQVLEQSGEFEVVGQAADGNEAVKVASQVSNDVVRMDVIMSNKDGVEACREIIEASPETWVLMMTASSEEAVVTGATGFLQKETDRLLAVVRGVFLGELRLASEVVRRVFPEILTGTQMRDAAGTGLARGHILR